MTSNSCQFHQHFTYKFFIQTSFFYIHVTREKLPKRHLYENCVHNVDEIDTWGRFYQRSTAAFAYGDPESVKRYWQFDWILTLQVQKLLVECWWNWHQFAEIVAKKGLRHINSHIWINTTVSDQKKSNLCLFCIYSNPILENAYNFWSLISKFSFIYVPRFKYRLKIYTNK